MIPDARGSRRIRRRLGVLAHRRCRPRTRPYRVSYGDSTRGVIDDVINEATAAAEKAVAAGVARDSGSDRPDARLRQEHLHGLALLRHMDDLVNTGWPVLMALSNKISSGRLLGVELTERLEGTLAATALAAAAGAGCSGRTRSGPPGGCWRWWRRSTGTPAGAHGERTGMTASELVDLAARGGAGRHTRRRWWPTELDPPAVDGRGAGSRQGRTDHLGGAARAQRGRHRRIGDREHLAVGRRAGRRADRARLGIHRRHRDPGDRRGRTRRQPRAGIARIGRGPARARCCGARWPRPAATSWSSSTRT